MRLHPRQGEAPAGQSKIGGLFLWPKEEPWPTPPDTDQVRLVPVLQLRIEDVPELGFRPGSDLFQLLWDPRARDTTYGPTPYAFWRKRSQVKNPIAVTPDPSNGIDVSHDNLPQPCVIHPERVIEFPDVFVISDDMPGLMEQLNSSIELQRIAEVDEEIFEEPNVVYQYLLSTCPRHEGQRISGMEAKSPTPNVSLRARDGVPANHFLRRVGWWHLEALAPPGRTTEVHQKEECREFTSASSL